jgi:hypothetical protein
MAKIKGITITLYERKQTGVDGAHRPIYEEIPVKVDNVIVYPTTSDDIVSTTELEGKKAVYTLCIPKGDTHVWEDSVVEFFGNKYKSFGFTQQYEEELLPLSWNKKVLVERYG